MENDFDEIWRVITAGFRLGDWSIHGPNHWRNVEQNGLALARSTGADETVVRLFAVLHDAKRRNDAWRALSEALREFCTPDGRVVFENQAVCVAGRRR